MIKDETSKKCDERSLEEREVNTKYRVSSIKYQSSYQDIYEGEIYKNKYQCHHNFLEPLDSFKKV